MDVCGTTNDETKSDFGIINSLRAHLYVVALSRFLPPPPPSYVETHTKKISSICLFWSSVTLLTDALLKARRRKARKELPFYLEPRTAGSPRQDDPTYFIRKLRDVIQRRRTTWNRNASEGETRARSRVNFFCRTAVNFRSLEDDYCPLYNLLAMKPWCAGSARSSPTHTPVREHAPTHTHTYAYTPVYVCIHVAGTFPTGALVYVNCIRNSEYPANFLHTDHSRISAKRTSIRRSLHHKFRCTWCNAHLVEAPRVAFGMHRTRALLSPMLRLYPTDSRVFRLFVGC